MDRDQHLRGSFEVFNAMGQLKSVIALREIFFHVGEAVVFFIQLISFKAKFYRQGLRSLVPSITLMYLLR